MPIFFEENENNVGIMNFASFSIHNYGAVLVGYAMEHVTTKIGYKPKTIYFIPKYLLPEATAENVFSSFRKKFLKLTGICTDKDELIKHINKNFSRICIGSDQIVRAEWHMDFIYYLDWVYGKKTLVSYAASFGVSGLRMRNIEKIYAKKCFDRFDAFSVREHNGVQIVKTEFGKNCPLVCDPTMLLSAEDYQPIIMAEATLKLPQNYVAYYFLYTETEVLSNLAETYLLIDARKDEKGNYRSVGDWLNIIKNAKYVVTDSFHGSIFSIIYRKQFIVLPTADGGNERLTSLMSLLQQNRFKSDSENICITENEFSNAIDYEKLLPILEKMKLEGYEYLKNALAIKPNYKTELSKRLSYKIIKLMNIPIIKVSTQNEKKYMRLFNFIPLLKIKNDWIYLFSFLKIAKIEKIVK